MPVDTFDVGEVREPASAPPEAFGERPELGVVVHDDRDVERIVKRRRDVDLRPAGQDRGRAEAAGIGDDRPGKTDAHADQIGARLADHLEHLSNRGFAPGVAVRGPVSVAERLVVLGEHVVGEVGDGNAHVPVAEIDAGDKPRVRIQGDLARSPSVMANERDARRPLFGQLANDVRHGCGRQPGGARDLRLGESSRGSKHAHGLSPIGFAKRGERPARSRSVHGLNSVLLTEGVVKL